MSHFPLGRFAVFNRVRRVVEHVLSRPERRKLVPHTFDGPRVTYRVEGPICNFKYSKFFNLTGHLQTTLQQYLRKMPSEKEAFIPICPPSSVQGMKVLNKDMFRTTFLIPGIKVPSRHISVLSKKKQLPVFKMQRIKAVAELSEDDPLHQSHKLFLLDPQTIHTVGLSEEARNTLAELGVQEDIGEFSVEIGYNNWNTAEVLRAVLPGDSEGVSGFSLIGHIAHLNLRPDVMDFKHLIGEVILDKNSSVKTVVNKLNNIDNTFRNFQMELLAGEDNFITRVKENGCVFEMDFSKVYWNSRLSTEHQRVVDMLNKGDVLYDVFAGVGPFSIPAAKKGAMVHANDLNPDSYSALTDNIKLNRIKVDRLSSYNMDGKDFIQTVLKQDLVSQLQRRIQNSCRTNCDSAVQGTDTADQTASIADSNDGQKLYITMNLPALAPEFLGGYCGLLSDFPKESQSHPCISDALPTLLCYSFSNSDNKEADVISRAEKEMGCKLPSNRVVRTVRNVAPHKEMMCLLFQLTPDIVFCENITNIQSDCHGSQQTTDGEPASKKQKMSEGL